MNKPVFRIKIKPLKLKFRLFWYGAQEEAEFDRMIDSAESEAHSLVIGGFRATRD